MPKVLIVEDNEENRDSLSRRLQRRGFAVVTADDGKAGLAMAQSEKPDLILMDMNMPELDGWEATRQIKALDGFQDVPVLALTAHALAGDKERALQVGCADYHTKPVDFPKLLAQMETMLQNRSTTAKP
ncbi:MAG TPA: response regulator [Gemmataceae bacterium]|nr:response regulator [Gemmataceae bacterium]